MGENMTRREVVNLDKGGDLWLGWVLGPGDLGADLGRAVAAFRGKPWAAGRDPEVIRACPELAGNGLGVAAAALGLVVIPDKTAARGLVYLGQKGGGESEAT